MVPTHTASHAKVTANAPVVQCSMPHLVCRPLDEVKPTRLHAVRRQHVLPPQEIAVTTVIHLEHHLREAT